MLAILSAMSIPPLAAAGLDAAAIGRAAGAEATTTNDGVVRVGWPRSDVKVTVDGVPLQPFAGLGSWAAFHATADGAIVTGDTVVFEDEADAAMDAAFASGLEVTALHNHFFFDEPRAFFLHIGGHGQPAALAAGVKAVWDAVKAVRAREGAPGHGFGGVGLPQGNHVTASALQAILGAEPALGGGVVKFSWALPSKMAGVEVSGSMGVSTWAAFSGADDLAAVSGDFAMRAAEVQPVLKALRRGGLHIVALHHHMIDEEPAVYFVHFWGKDTAAALARAVRGALDARLK